MTLLRAEGLAIVRGGRLLMEGVDLHLEAGDGWLLTGSNGAGKSSLLRCLAGLLPATAGRLTVKRGIALADERLPLDPELALQHALGLWRRLDGGQADVKAALTLFGLAELVDVPVRLLSSGQRKRAALALVAMGPAGIWLLDEPLNALDQAGAERLTQALAAHRRSGGAVVVATHQPLGSGDWHELALGR